MSVDVLMLIACTCERNRRESEVQHAAGRVQLSIIALSMEHNSAENVG